jgi:exodeoxyribonuclease VII small subunit
MTQNKKKLSFEQAMNALEDIVTKMETGNVPLEEMIRQYEEARKMAAYCQNVLNEMKQKIEILTNETGNGKWREMSRRESVPDENDFFALQNDDNGEDE